MYNDCSKTIFSDRICVSYRVIWFKINTKWYSIFISNNKTQHRLEIFSDVPILYLSNYIF